MFQCLFELNGRELSEFRIGAHAFAAFSGLGRYANSRSVACTRGQGPIPPGKYYIIDRQSGGILGGIRDLLTGRDDWFALYAADGRIDDETFCDGVSRGSFRLHPKGRLGRSEGCVDIEREQDFIQLRSILRSLPPGQTPGMTVPAYGILLVI